MRNIKIPLLEANNVTLHHMKRFEEVGSLLRKMIPVTRRVLGDNHEDDAQDEVELRAGALRGRRRLS